MRPSMFGFLAAVAPVGSNADLLLEVRAAKSPSQVLEVLDSINLKGPLEDCITTQSIDGETLMGFDRQLVEDACPAVPALQWARLWKHIRPSAVEVEPDGVTSPSGARILGADDDLLPGYSGVKIATNMSAVQFGLDSAVYRTEDGLKVLTQSLMVEGDIRWSGSSPHDSSVDDHESRLAALETRVTDTEARLDAEEALSLATQCSLLYQGRACMSSVTALHDQSYFYSNFEGSIHGAFLVYANGYVTCNSATDTRQSNWGCGDDDGAMGAWLLDGDTEDVLYPTEYVAHGTSGAWYDEDDAKGWWPSAEYLWFEGEMDVTAGKKFHLQFGEAWLQSTTSDNEGTTCADVYWKVGPCDIQTDGRVL